MTVVYATIKYIAACVQRIFLLCYTNEIDNEWHFQHFWMSAGAFDNLLQSMDPHIKHGNTHSGQSGYLWPCAFLAASYKLGSETVSCIIKEVCHARWIGLKDEFVRKWWEVTRRDFWDLWNYSNCARTVDGKHVWVKRPANSSSFYNYKGFFSFILMSACDTR